MTSTTPALTTIATGNRAFVIRLRCDQTSGQWRILLKPVNGQEARLFGTIEAALLYLEAVMQQEQTRPNPCSHNSMPKPSFPIQ